VVCERFVSPRGTLNYRVAAEELSVTASAVSHQIKSLEDELGYALFAREKRSLKLTERGRRLYSDLEPAIGQIDSIIAESMNSIAKRQLRVSVQPFFASEVFVPRLEEFSARYPEIELFVDTSDETAEKHPVSVDASIRLFRRAPANLDADMLFPPASTTRLLPRFPGTLSVRRRHHDNLIPDARTYQPARSMVDLVQSIWRGVARRVADRASRFDDCGGPGGRARRRRRLVPVPLSDNWFKYGALVPLFDDVVTMPEAFYLVHPPSSARSAEVQALRQWVLDTFQENAG
jgi:LysR family glycine cleavage system transcriptional activator